MNLLDKVTISNVVEGDLDNILSLARLVSEKDVFPTLSIDGQHALIESQEKDVKEILNREIYNALKVEIESKLVAYIAWRNHCHLAQLYVDSEFQGKGIGTLLINEAIKMIKAPSLRVRSSINAVDFYKNNGFMPTGSETEINKIKFVPMERKLKNI